jgi:hypothetical protein
MTTRTPDSPPPAARKRRPYTRPTLEKVQVRLDEAMATGCKSGVMGGPPGGGGCGACMESGS